MLEGANVKLSGTVSNINGMSAQTLLDYLETGEEFDMNAYEREVKAKRISKRLKASPEQLIRDMEGNCSESFVRILREVRSHIKELDHHIENLDRDINMLMKSNQAEAVNLISEVPGIKKRSAEIVISAIGTDMSRFPTEKHIASWAGLCPGNHESARKRKTGRTTKGNKNL